MVDDNQRMPENGFEFLGLHCGMKFDKRRISTRSKRVVERVKILFRRRSLLNKIAAFKQAYKRIFWSFC